MSSNSFKKELTLSQLIAMAAGGMIAAWMVEITYWFEMSGPGSLICLIACAVIIFPLCLIYAEMTSTLPYAGGENIWASNAYGWNCGWFVFWFMFLLYLSAMPNVTIGIATMISYLVPLSFAQLKIVSLALITIWFVLVNFNIKYLAIAQNVMFWGTLVIAIIADIIFILSDQWSFSNLSPWFPTGVSGFAVGLGLLMGWAYYMMLRNYSSQISIITSEGLLPALVIILAFTAGSALVMWLGEQITEFGIGNGISMILFANIISSIPGMVGTLATLVWWQIIIVLVGIVALVLFIVFINDAERRIPIQYAKRVVGRKVYGGQNTNLPIKVAMSGVMPIIFAQSICSLPATICAFTGKTSGWWYDHVWSSSSWIYAVIYFIMIFFFSWFYSTIQYDTVEISNNLKSNGGFIPGFRPGKPTADFIQKVINKIIVFGSVYLGIVALLPIIAGNLMEGVKNLAIGGTSVIIVVGVALETVKALEAQMLMRHYKGFLD